VAISAQEIKAAGENEFQKESEDFLSKAFVVATFLTLIVLPTLYSLFSSVGEKVRNATQWVHDIYWRPYHWLAGEKITRKE